MISIILYGPDGSRQWRYDGPVTLVGEWLKGIFDNLTASYPANGYRIPVDFRLEIR